MSCEGFWFKEGNKYIVYARKGKNGFTESYCGGAVLKTEEKGQFEKELEYLDSQNDGTALEVNSDSQIFCKTNSGEKL